MPAATPPPPPRPRRRESRTARAARAAEIQARLAGRYPDVTTALHHGSAWDLLVATILSAQSTDEVVNKVTPELFRRWPTVADVAAADRAELERVIHSTGFFRMKAKAIQEAARYLLEQHGGEVPDRMEDLVALPGVGRKTANVVLGSFFAKNEGVVVDTHVGRIARRLGLTANADPVKVEQDLMPLVPREDWTVFAHRLIWFGRPRRHQGRRRPRRHAPPRGRRAAGVSRPPAAPEGFGHGVTGRLLPARPGIRVGSAEPRSGRKGGWSLGDERAVRP